MKKCSLTSRGRKIARKILLDFFVRCTATISLSFSKILLFFFTVLVSQDARYLLSQELQIAHFVASLRSFTIDLMIGHRIMRDIFIIRVDEKILTLRLDFSATFFVLLFLLNKSVPVILQKLGDVIADISNHGNKMIYDCHFELLLRPGLAKLYLFGLD